MQVLVAIQVFKSSLSTRFFRFLFAFEHNECPWLEFPGHLQTLSNLIQFWIYLVSRFINIYPFLISKVKTFMIGKLYFDMMFEKKLTNNNIVNNYK